MILPQCSKEINEIVNKNLDNKMSIGYNKSLWKPNTLYKVGEIVKYNDLVITCKETHMSSNTFEDKYWAYETKKGFY